MKAFFSTLLVAAALLAAGCATNLPRHSPSSPVCAESPAAPAEQEIAALFDRWNQSLQSGEAQKVVANYAEQSLLLPTFSDKPRITREEKMEYFEHFLKNQPSGKIAMRQIQVDRDMAVDTGLYTFHLAKTGEDVRARYSFTYRRYGSQWLIISHHSSAMPEK